MTTEVMHLSGKDSETLRGLCRVTNPSKRDYLMLCSSIPVINQKRVACPVADCRTVPKGKADFLEHLNTAHLKFPSHPCNSCDHGSRRNRCDRVFYGSKAYRRHLRVSSPASPVPSSIPPPSVLPPFSSLLPPASIHLPPPPSALLFLASIITKHTPKVLSQ